MSDEYANIEKLKGAENFQLWKYQTTILFKSQASYDIVTEEKLKPEGEDAKPEEIASWIRKDAQCQKIIMSTVDRSLLVHTMQCKTAAETWKVFTKMFENKADERKCQLMQDFYSFKFSRNEKVTTSVSKLSNLFNQMKSLDNNLSDDLLTVRIISLLPDSYNTFATAWRLNGNKNLSDLIANLITEENQHDFNEEPQVAFVSQNTQCFSCQKFGHLSRNCPEKRSKPHRNKTAGKPQKPDDERCTICKKNNHTASSCYFREGGKYHKKPSDVKSDEPAKPSFLFANIATTSVDDENSLEFAVDSACTTHVTNNFSALKEVRSTETEIGVAKKGHALKITKAGKIDADECLLNDVLFSPDLSKNLMSVGEIVKSDAEVIFSKSGVKIVKNGSVVLSGPFQENGLFTVKLNQSEQQHGLMLSKIDCVMDWHKKLGHLGATKMREVQAQCIGTNFSVVDIEKILKNCEICFKAKQTRESFGKERTRGSRVLEIIHTDVFGPADETWDGKRYYVSFQDDFTGFIQIYLMAHKDEVFGFFKEYVAEVEAKWGQKISRLRSDGGGEYVSKQLIDWCKNRGIVLERTPPATPQLNSRAERFNRSVCDKIRAMLFESGLDNEMWGEAALAAVHVMNRTPKQSLNNKTPYEMWNNGRKPDLSYLQVFGSTAYAKNNNRLKKFDERSKRFLFVGFTSMGYRLFDEKARKIIVSRDVRFVSPDKTKFDDEKYNSVKILLENENTEKVDNAAVQNPDGNEIQEENNANQEPQENIDENQPANQNDNVAAEADTSTIAETDESDASLTSASEWLPSDTDDSDGTVVAVQEGERRYPQRERTQTKPFGHSAMLAGNLTYKSAMQGPDKHLWKAAIEEEMQAHDVNQTWETVNRDQAKGKKILTNTWVFRIKDDGRYKARLVVRGCEQKEGVDYAETYSPVVSNNTIRLIFALGSKNQYKITKFDVKTAFLHGNLDQEVYMWLPEGCKAAEGDMICKLNKCLYGLKQSPLKWYETLTNFLVEAGLKQIIGERCVFISENSDLILAFHIDDGFLLSRDESQKQKLLDGLEREFKITVVCNPRDFLGMEICKGNNELTVSQGKYVKQVVQKFNMNDSQFKSTPIVTQDRPNAGKAIENLNPIFPFRQAVGSILYAASKTRPDIAYAVNVVSRYLENPTEHDVQNVKRILRYLNGNSKAFLKFSGDGKNVLYAYSDADFAGDKIDRKSTSGFVIMYMGGPVGWRACKQPIVATSTTESEFIAADLCAKELVYLKAVLEQLTGVKVPAILYVDNQSAIHLIQNGIFNSRSKHIEVRFHSVTEKVQQKRISVEYCPSEHQLADILTKPLPKNRFETLKKAIICFE